MTLASCGRAIAACVLLALPIVGVDADTPPNIVLIFPDNIGVGEIGVYGGNQVRAVKWREWKLHYAWQDDPAQPAEPVMRLFNLRSEPKEETDVKDLNPWAPSVMGKVVDDFNATLKQYPLIPLGTPDPYTPPR